jgi:hypothetical protein
MTYNLPFVIVLSVTEHCFEAKRVNDNAEIELILTLK